MSQPLYRPAYRLPKAGKVTLFYAALGLAALLWFTPVITPVLTALKDAGDFAVNVVFRSKVEVRQISQHDL